MNSPITALAACTYTREKAGGFPLPRNGMPGYKTVNRMREAKNRYPSPGSGDYPLIRAGISHDRVPDPFIAD